VKGDREALISTLGYIAGGIVVGLLEAWTGTSPTSFVLSADLGRIILGGLLVGFGSKLSHGCTSGHMISGLSRLSPRSLTATVSFFITGVITATFLYGGKLPAIGETDWSLGDNGIAFLALESVPLIVSALIYYLAPEPIPADSKLPIPSNETTPLSKDASPRSNSSLRLLAASSAAYAFAIALRLSNLTDPLRVISFLLLPIDKAFDPSLFFLAIGALPLSIALYHFGLRDRKPRLGGEWGVPQSGKIDAKLVFGAAVFGVGWGITGICPGPGLVNLGRAFVGGVDVLPVAAWVASVAAGGIFVE